MASMNASDAAFGERPTLNPTAQPVGDDLGMDL
jgi:hypothetical protein